MIILKKLDHNQEPVQDLDPFLDLDHMPIQAIMEEVVTKEEIIDLRVKADHPPQANVLKTGSNLPKHLSNKALSIDLGLGIGKDLDLDQDLKVTQDLRVVMKKDQVKVDHHHQKNVLRTGSNLFIHQIINESSFKQQITKRNLNLMALDLGLDQDLDLDFKATLDLIEAVKDQKKAQKIHLLQMRIIRYKVKNIIQERRKEGGKLKRLYFEKSWRIFRHI